MDKCRVSISVYFALLVSCLMVLDSTGLSVLALICAAIHESGHFIAIAALGKKTESVSFRIFGVEIRLRGGADLSYSGECIIALSGCAANLAAALVFFLLARAGAAPGKTLPMCGMNLLLCAFNLLPVGPLDGGMAAAALLRQRFGLAAAHNIIGVTSVIFIVPLCFAAVFTFFRSGFNLSLLLVCVYLAVCLFAKDRLFDCA